MIARPTEEAWARYVKEHNLPNTPRPAPQELIVREWGCYSFPYPKKQLWSVRDLEFFSER